MIKNFKCKKTEKLYIDRVSRKFNSIITVALRKLDMIDYAKALYDLSNPPGNMLESLSGDRKGQHSIRINTQYRICFIWNEGAKEIEIVDYH